MKNKVEKRNPWAWIPSLYYAEGIPYVIVMLVSVIMYKRMGISNTDIALYTSWLYLPWVIKPLWSPVVDIFKTKRFWIVIMQLFIGAGLAGVAFTIPVSGYFQLTLAFFWLLAFSSATHDIAADGFYMLALPEHEQAFFVGIRSTFYRIAMITGQGLLVILAGYFESSTGLPTVDVEVFSNPNAAVVEIVEPDSVKFEVISGERQIAPLYTNIEINTDGIASAKADSIINSVKKWNILNGFSEEEKVLTTGQAEEDEGLWSSIVVNPLESFLRDNFGEEKPIVKSVQNKSIGLIYFKLSEEPLPDEKIEANFGFSSGDKSISLVEGQRFIFTNDNWNKPAIAVVQLDPKLKWQSSASFEMRAGNVKLAWVITFSILAILFVAFFIYHKFILPYPKSDVAVVKEPGQKVFAEFFKTFKAFFSKKRIGVILGFLLLYRFGEAQLAKLASPFLLDAKEAGGMGLTTGDYGIAYGTIGIIALTLGGLIGGWVVSRKGLKFWLWPMLLAMNLPNLVYVYLSLVMPDSFFIITACVAIEQFGYGFGFTAYMLYMIYVADGEYKTAHFALATGFMALGMMIPGMFSGWLQEIIGYQNFFIWVMIATIPAFVVTYFIELKPGFGRKTE